VSQKTFVQSLPGVKSVSGIRAQSARPVAQHASLSTFHAASFAWMCGDRKLARILTRLAIGETQRAEI